MMHLKVVPPPAGTLASTTEYSLGQAATLENIMIKLKVEAVRLRTRTLRLSRAGTESGTAPSAPGHEGSQCIQVAPLSLVSATATGSHRASDRALWLTVMVSPAPAGRRARRDGLRVRLGP